jgi:hypothetical protein
MPHSSPSARRMRLATTLGLLLSVGVLAPAAVRAGEPEQFGPFVETGDFIGFECDGFDIRIQGTASTSFTVWFDADGNLERLLQRTRAPHDTLTNTVTGKSIVVRGEFQEHVTYDATTDTWLKTITGHRYFVNEPGSGVTVRDVGRIQYGDLEQTVLLWQAGKHDIEWDANLQPLFCDRLG